MLCFFASNTKSHPEATLYGQLVYLLCSFNTKVNPGLKYMMRCGFLRIPREERPAMREICLAAAERKKKLIIKFRFRLRARPVLPAHRCVRAFSFSSIPVSHTGKWRSTPVHAPADHFPLPRAKDEPPAAQESHLNAARAPRKAAFFVLYSSRGQEIILKGKEKNAVPLLVIFIYYHLPAQVRAAHVQQPRETFTFWSLWINPNGPCSARTPQGIIYLPNHVCAVFACECAQWIIMSETTAIFGQGIFV